MERPHKQQKTARITTRQAVLLVVIAALGLLGLSIAALALLSPEIPNAPAEVVSSGAFQPAATPPAESVAEEPEAEAPWVGEQGTLAPRQLLPAGCEPIYGSLVESPAATIVDHQTLEVTIGQTTARIRLAGINFPDEAGVGGAGVAELQSLMDGQPVVLALDSSAPDEQGRLPAYIFSNGWFLNQELILRGVARADSAVLGQACSGLFQETERQARQALVGIWQPTRVPTATFLPTVGADSALQAPCDCMARPVCSDFSRHDEAQACYNACNDYNSRLDDDRDGLACEELP